METPTDRPQPDADLLRSTAKANGVTPVGLGPGRRRRPSRPRPGRTDPDDLRPGYRPGFTLIELLMVLVILATMVAVTVPYARRSHEGLRLEQEGRNVAEAVRYATELAEDINRPIRLLLDVDRGCYSLEMADATGDEYVAVEDPIGAVRSLDSKVRVVDVSGFEFDGKNSYCLSLDPRKPWPEASISLATGNFARRIRVTGKLVEVENATE